MRKLLYFLLLVSITGCGVINPSIMLKTKDNYQYSTLKDTSGNKEYRIAPNDIIDFKLFTNDGFKLIDLTFASERAVRNDFDYLVDVDGTVKLPVLGRILLKGLTAREAELMLEEKFANFYIDPFVVLTVNNRRVIVFPGSPGDAKVIPLRNNNTTLMEALALAGGISENGKARKIKLIRENQGKPDQPFVYLIDLSTIEGLKYTGLVLQANDLIYVEPRKNIAGQILREVTPVLSLITSALLIYSIFNRFTPN